MIPKLSDECNSSSTMPSLAVYASISQSLYTKCRAALRSAQLTLYFVTFVANGSFNSLANFEVSDKI